MSRPDELKEKFKQLMQEMTDLVKSTPDAELDKIRIDVLSATSIPKPCTVVCRTEQEFMLKMSERITGIANQRAYILQHWDSMSDASIKEHREKAAKQGRLFILPSIVEPHSTYNPETTFEPYIAFFTHDKKVFLYPRDGEYFSDVTESEEEI